MRKCIGNHGTSSFFMAGKIMDRVSIAMEVYGLRKSSVSMGGTGG